MADTRANRSTGKHVIYLNDKVNSSYVKKTYTNFKFTEDLQQDIIIPSFDGWSECNLVCFANDTIGKRWYWITAVSRTSAVSGALMLTLVIDPIATALKGGPTVVIDAEALPFETYPLKVQCANGTLAPMQTYKLEQTIYTVNSRKDGTGTARTYHLGWCSIATNTSCNEFWANLIEGSYTQYVNKTAGYNIYGFPIILDYYNGDDRGVYLVAVAGENYYSCLGLQDILNRNIASNTLGFTQSEIVDISITNHIPCSYTLTPQYTDDVLDHIDIKLKNNSNALVRYLRPNTNENEGRAIYKISGITGIVDNVNSGTFFLESATGYGQMVIEYPYADCSIYLTDYMGNNISEIPNNCIKKDGQMDIREKIIFDYSGIIRHIEVFPNYDDASQVIQINFNEPHLPYIGTSWETYKAYSQQGDREAMISNIGFGMANTVISSAAGAGMGLAVGSTTGSMIAMQSGAQAGSGAIGIAQTVYNQKLKERNIRRQPPQAISSGYGIHQIINGLQNPPGITMYRPKTFEKNKLDYFIAHHGYPAVGTYPITFDAESSGYYEGAIYSGLAVNGPLMDELNNVLMQGCIITVDNSTDDPPTAGSSTS